jgi:PAS domain S-box-containing protein
MREVLYLQNLSENPVVINGFDGRCQETINKVTESKSEQKYKNLISMANVLVQSVNAEGRFLYVNDEWKRVLGYTDSDLDSIDISKVIRCDHLPDCMKIFTQVMNGTSIHDHETIFVTKDNREINVSGNICPIFEDGKFTYTTGFFLDITQRKKTEEQLYEGTRKIEIMNEKLRVVGNLTRHDVRNKLSAVNGYTYILKKKHCDQPDTLQALKKIEEAIVESDRIFDFAKMYEQLGVENLAYVDVESNLNEAQALFSCQLPNVINECKGLTILADSFLRQLFYNMIDNTRKYGQKATKIKVHYEKADDDSLKLVYEDDGVGVPLESKELLFKEGFSTGGSTGYGLFLIRKMMDVYCWKIEEKGEPYKGAKFIITVPNSNKTGQPNYRIKK